MVLLEMGGAAVQGCFVDRADGVAPCGAPVVPVMVVVPVVPVVFAVGLPAGVAEREGALEVDVDGFGDGVGDGAGVGVVTGSAGRAVG
ncbi:hypothetical protein GCM10020229_53020 [Kitasatospora albolonga]